MIRDRLKSAARKFALKAFGMERDASDREPLSEERAPASAEEIARLMPRVVDGSGDTPGPNHRERIGRTWLSAQVVSGVPGALFDLRPPEEYAQGHLPGAALVPGRQLQRKPELLPEKGARITVYDADGGSLSHELASWLRAEGWGMARNLQGGWAEWLEHGELVETSPELAQGRRVGDPVDLPGGRRGVLQGARRGDEGLLFDVLMDPASGEMLEGVSAAQLDRAGEKGG